MNEDKFYENLGLNISKVRLNARVTQEDLAVYLELSRVSIVNIEKGRQRPSVFVLTKIAKYLNTELNELVPQNTELNHIDLTKDVIGAEKELDSASKKSLNEFFNLIVK